MQTRNHIKIFLDSVLWIRNVFIWRIWIHVFFRIWIRIISSMPVVPLFAFRSVRQKKVLKYNKHYFSPFQVCNRQFKKKLFNTVWLRILNLFRIRIRQKLTKSFGFGSTLLCTSTPHHCLDFIIYYEWKKVTWNKCLIQIDLFDLEHPQ
jgi:hypothetical protein